MSDSAVSHLLAAATLFARLADLGSTYVVSPGLELEANDLVRRFRWPFAAVTLGVCVLPYLDSGLGVIVAVASLFVAAANIRQAWLVRALGEADYLALLRSAAARSGRRAILASVFASALFVGLAGLLLWFFYPTPSWARSFAIGVLAYAAAIAIHGSRFSARIAQR